MVRGRTRSAPVAQPRVDAGEHDRGSQVCGAHPVQESLGAGLGRTGLGRGCAPVSERYATARLHAGEPQSSRIRGESGNRDGANGTILRDASDMPVVKLEDALRLLLL